MTQISGQLLAPAVDWARRMLKEETDGLVEAGE